MTITYDPAEFYAGLVEHGHIIPVGVQGAFGRGAVFEDILERFNDVVSQIASADGAETLFDAVQLDDNRARNDHYGMHLVTARPRPFRAITSYWL